MYIFHTGKLQLRNLIILTSKVEKNWYALGMALRIPIRIMEKFYEKYHENLMKALNRVYQFWLADKNHLLPTWDKLIAALRKIKEYKIAADVEQFLKVSLTNRVSCVVANTRILRIPASKNWKSITTNK